MYNKHQLKKSNWTERFEIQINLRKMYLNIKFDQFYDSISTNVQWKFFLSLKQHLKILSSVCISQIKNFLKFLI